MINKNKVYIVWKSGAYANIALNVNISSEGDAKSSAAAELTFNDTNRVRIFTGQLVGENTAGFSFKTDDGEDFVFELATRKKFDQVVQPTIEGILPPFNYEEDLHEFYRRRFR